MYARDKLLLTYLEKNIIFIKRAVVFNLLLAIKRFADINYVRVFKNI